MSDPTPRPSAAPTESETPESEMRDRVPEAEDCDWCRAKIGEPCRSTATGLPLKGVHVVDRPRPARNPQPRGLREREKITLVSADEAMRALDCQARGVPFVPAAPLSEIPSERRAPEPDDTIGASLSGAHRYDGAPFRAPVSGEEGRGPTCPTCGESGPTEHAKVCSDAFHVGQFMLVPAHPASGAEPRAERDVAVGSLLDAYEGLANDEVEEIPEPLKNALDRLMQAVEGAASRAVPEATGEPEKLLAEVARTQMALGEFDAHPEQDSDESRVELEEDAEAAIHAALAWWTNPARARLSAGSVSGDTAADRERLTEQEYERLDEALEAYIEDHERDAGGPKRWAAAIDELKALQAKLAARRAAPPGEGR